MILKRILTKFNGVSSTTFYWRKIVPISGDLRCSHVLAMCTTMSLLMEDLEGESNLQKVLFVKVTSFLIYMSLSWIILVEFYYTCKGRIKSRVFSSMMDVISHIFYLLMISSYLWKIMKIIYPTLRMLFSSLKKLRGSILIFQNHPYHL